MTTTALLPRVALHRRSFQRLALWGALDLGIVLITVPTPVSATAERVLDLKSNTFPGVARHLARVVGTTCDVMPCVVTMRLF